MALTAEQQMQAAARATVENARVLGMNVGNLQRESAALMVLQRAYAMAIAEAIDHQGSAGDPARTLLAIDALRENLEKDVRLQVFYRGGKPG